MNGKINLHAPFILKLAFSKMKFYKIRRAPSTITKTKTYFDCRSWIFPSLSSTYSSSLFVNEKQSIISLQPIDGIPHNLFICCVTATSSIVKATLYHAFRKGYVIRMKSIRRGFLYLGLGRFFFHTFFLLWGFQWKRYKRWSSVCRPCGVENK